MYIIACILSNIKLLPIYFIFLNLEIQKFRKNKIVLKSNFQHKIIIWWLDAEPEKVIQCSIFFCLVSDCYFPCLHTRLHGERNIWEAIPNLYMIELNNKEDDSRYMYVDMLCYQVLNNEENEDILKMNTNNSVILWWKWLWVMILKENKWTTS